MKQRATLDNAEREEKEKGRGNSNDSQKNKKKKKNKPDEKLVGVNGVLQRSPWFDLPNLDLIKTCPADTMHGVDLGVTKKMFSLIFKEKASKEVAPGLLKFVNKLCRTCNVPSEYSRRGRDVDISRLKASEWHHMAKVLSIPIALELCRSGM